MKKFICLLLSILGTCCLFAYDTDTSFLVENNTKFTLDLYQKLSYEKGNLCFSPYSISTVLAMAYGGAYGQTASEMAKTLHFSLTPEQLHEEFFTLNSKLKESCKNAKIQLLVANSFWPHIGYPFLEKYIRLLTEKYGSSVIALDYKQDPEKGRGRINSWVEENTQNLIKDLLPAGSITPMTRLVLVNAIYFKSNWEYPFLLEKTKDEKFHLSKDSSVMIPLMHQKAHFNYAQFPNFTILELPYKDYAFSMLVLLPNAIDGLADLEKQVNVSALKEWSNALQSCEVNIYLPRFKIAADFSLSKTLKRMGMVIPFESAADFSGMGGNPGDLYISDVIHKAVIEVNEQGSEAAAATALVICKMSLPVSPKHFRADRPFIFVIRENTTGTILFIGKLISP